MRNVTSSSYGFLKGTGKTKGVADISGECLDYNHIEMPCLKNIVKVPVVASFVCFPCCM